MGGHLGQLGVAHRAVEPERFTDGGDDLQRRVDDLSDGEVLFAPVGLVVVPVRPAPSPPARFVLVEVACLLDLRLRECHLAAGEVGCLSEDLDPSSVVALEVGPAKSPLGVLVIEQHDQPIGGLQCSAVAVPAGLRGVREVTVEELGCGASDRRVAHHRCRGTAEEEVVGEHHAMTGLDREDLVSRVGVEGDEGQR